MKEGKYDEAWEKAGAIGMVVGMSEMRAGIERHIKNHKPDEKSTEKLKEIRKTLTEADLALAEATKSFVGGEPDGESQFLNHLREAFRKTTMAQTKILEVVI
jgi:hypothetical protein